MSDHLKRPDREAKAPSRTSSMPVSEESDHGLVLRNPSSKDGHPSAERGGREARGPTGTRARSPRTRPSAGLTRPRDWPVYEKLHANGGRRVDIPKPDGRQRPLGIAALANKTVEYYALDLWGEAWQKHITQGDRVVVRVANDFVLGFEYRTDAEWFLAALRGCLHRFWLDLHTEKTRLIELGPHSIANRKQRGEGKPEMFDILGFTHICERSGRPATLPSAVRPRTSAWGEAESPTSAAATTPP